MSYVAAVGVDFGIATLGFASLLMTSDRVVVLHQFGAYADSV